MEAGLSGPFGEARKGKTAPAEELVGLRSRADVSATRHVMGGHVARAQHAPGHQVRQVLVELQPQFRAQQCLIKALGAVCSGGEPLADSLSARW